MITLQSLTNSFTALKCGVLKPGGTLTFETLPPGHRQEALYLQGAGALRFVEILPVIETPQPAEEETQKAASPEKRRPPLFLPTAR